MARSGKDQFQRRSRHAPTRRRAMLYVETLEARMLLSATSLHVDMELVHVLEPDHQTVRKDIVAGDPEDEQPDTPDDRIDENTTSSEFGGVGSLFMDLGDGSGFLCTGTLIGPTTVLTAAHCLDEDDNGTIDFAPQDVHFFLNYGSDFSHTFTASALHIQPDFTGFANPTVLDDLAIIELATPVPAGVPIYQISTTPFTDIETITLVGYGTTGDGVTGYISNSATFTIKRTGMNRADSYLSDDEGSGAREGFEWDFDGSSQSTNFFGPPIGSNLTLGNDVETAVGPGDSGGPSFIDDGNGGLLLFGVNTFTSGAGAEAPLFGSVGGGIVVAPYADWITPFITTPSATVVARQVFYNNSFFDGDDAGINANDDGAIDTSKSAYLSGSGPATDANITGYDKGINGIAVDIQDLAVPGSISAADFVFKVGKNNSPDSWSDAPAPSAISVRTGVGVSGSDRLEITWADGEISNEWLGVQVLADGNTGLTAADYFFFGNAVGDGGVGNTTTAAPVNATDEIAARNNPHNFLNPALVDDPFDYNKDRSVNATDQIIARNNGTSFLDQLPKLDILSSTPFSADGAAVSPVTAHRGAAGISWGLVSASDSEGGSRRLAADGSTRMAIADSRGGRLSNACQLLDDAGFEVGNDDFIDSANIDDDLLESLAASLESRLIG